MVFLIHIKSIYLDKTKKLKMSKLKMLIGMFLLLAINLQAQNDIIPTPVSYSSAQGVFVLKKTTVVYLQNSTPEIGQIVKLYFDSFAKKGITVSTKKPVAKTNYINIALNKSFDKNIGNEGYTLDVNPKTITLKANTAKGIFYGLQTFDQLLPLDEITKENSKILSCSITDYPRFAWRGLMLDVSRHFFTPNEVKEYIDMMSKYKFNVLHWHLTDDEGWRIEIKALPKLTAVGSWRVERFGLFGEREAPKQGEKTPDGGFYTQEQIKDIIKYAAEKQISILPEVDVPGHSMALLTAYPELSTKKEPKMVSPGSKFADWHGDGTFTMYVENSLNPSDEKVYQALDLIFVEIAALFPGQYIHVGGDECYHGFWEKDANCQALMKKENLKDVKELQSYFIKRVEKIIASKGKKMIGWDEILDGGLAEGATVMSWRGIEGGIKAAKLGHEVVMSPTTFTYLDYMQGDHSVEVAVYSDLFLKKAYEFEPVPEGVDPKYILGGQANLWTEQVPTLQHAFYMTYPRAFATIESLWSPAKNKNWDNFAARVEKQFRRFDYNEISICKAVYDPIVKTKIEGEKLQCSLSSELSNVDIYYTIDGTFPAKYSPKYSNPFEIPEGDVTFRTVAYRNGKQIGKMLSIDRKKLKERAEK
jgi:hexosaminidase